MNTHKDLYPEQYRHELVGKFVEVVIDGNVIGRGMVERVTTSRFGPIAVLWNEPATGYRPQHCRVIDSGEAMIEIYLKWIKDQELPDGLSAEDLMYSEHVTEGQQDWLRRFVDQWETIDY